MSAGKVVAAIVLVAAIVYLVGNYLAEVVR
jgi:hypothetical protein